MIPLLDSLLKLATYPADTLPGRLGRRIRRVRLTLRRVVGAPITNIV